MKNKNKTLTDPFHLITSIENDRR